MFDNVGRYSSSLELNLSGWNLSNVTSISKMFFYAGRESSTVKLDLTDWNTSKIMNMNQLFYQMGYKSTKFELIGVDNWDTSNVTNMYAMFSSAGSRATYKLDLSTSKNVTKEDGTTYKAWDVSNVTSYSNFNYSVTSKVIAPTWVN